MLMSRIMEYFKLEGAKSRIVFIGIISLFSVHLFSCFFYIAAQMDDFGPNTWVY